MTVPVDGKRLDWPRLVANAINRLEAVLAARGPNPFEELDTEPADPIEGQSYYDTTTHKLRVFDGTVWQNAW